MFTVFIEGLDVYAYHGVPVEERVTGHRYRVDIELSVSGSADETDELSDTVDYAAVARLAQEILQGSQFRTVERLAGAIGDGLLASFELVFQASVSVWKPLPPMPFVVKSAGVRVVRHRNGDC